MIVGIIPKPNALEIKNAATVGIKNCTKLFFCISFDPCVNRGDAARQVFIFYI